LKCQGEIIQTFQDTMEDPSTGGMAQFLPRICFFLKKIYSPGNVVPYLKLSQSESHP
jgi:hypothetical protein